MSEFAEDPDSGREADATEASSLPVVEPLSPSDLPDALWTLRYEHGSPFSTGPIGLEVVWLFSTEEGARACIPDALEAEPDAGQLQVDLVSLPEVADRFAHAVYIDEINAWPVILSPDVEDDGPLPDEPFALFTEGGGIDRFSDVHHDGEWVIHRDDRGDFVLFFEDLDAAEKVLRDFEAATGKVAEVRRTRAVSLEFAQNVRFTHADGRWEDIERDEYLRRCR
ncbi:MAG: hypothetical protein ACKO5K_03850 [Armatimonadota bacterium]